MPARERSLYAEPAWRALPGFELALEARGQGRVPVNDLNSDFAAGFGLMGLRVRWLLDVPFAHAGRLEVLGRVDGEPVLVRQHNVLAATFHPELTDDARVHRLLIEATG